MKRKPVSIGKIAVGVVRINRPYYSAKLLEVIPQELRQKVVTDESAHSLMMELDEIRFQKARELAKMMGLHLNSRALSSAINSPLNSLLPGQEQKKKEIKFLFNVAATVIH